MSSSLGDLPDPTAAFNKRSLTLVSPPQHEWVRIYSTKYGVRFFSQKERTRWDSAGGPYGTMCVGENFETSFLEVFDDMMRVEDSLRFLTDIELSGRGVSKIRIPDDMKVVDIRDGNLARLRLDARIFSGTYAVSRKWSKAFMEHPDKPQGLLYNSRHNPANSNLVIFGTHPTGVPPLSSQVKISGTRPLITHKELKPTANKYEIGLVVSTKMKTP